MSPSTVRTWVAHGLVGAGRTPAGHRRFGDADLGRMREVRDRRVAQRLPLASIRDRLGEGRGDPGRAMGHRARASATSPGERHLGTRLRIAREARGVSLRGLSATASVSPSHLSAIERGHAHPSVATVQKLTSGLGITVGSLRSPDAPIAPLVLGGEAAVLEVGIPGVEIQDLAPAARALEPQLFTLAPGAGSGGAYRHDGEEFLYVLSGTIEVVLDDAEGYAVGPGDSLCFHLRPRPSLAQRGRGRRQGALGQHAADLLSGSRTGPPAPRNRAPRYPGTDP